MARKTNIAVLSVVAVALLAVLTLWSLGTNSPTNASAPTPEAVGPSALTSIDSRPRSEFQAALLADGELTEAEYDQAYEAYTACAVAAGAEIVGPGTKTRWGVYDFSIGVRPIAPGQPNREARAAADTCAKEYFDVVGARWSATHMVPREAMEAALRNIPDCMRAGGVEPPADTSRGWSQRFLETASREDGMVLVGCLKQANAEADGGSNSLPMP